MSARQAIIVPLYKEVLTPAERLSLERTLALLAQHDVYIVGPERLRSYFAQLSDQYDNRLHVSLFADQFFTGIEGYNRLLISERFYARFEAYEYMLIVQTDALVLSDELTLWCSKGYSYIGAPMFKGFTTPTQPLSLFCVGNGGFSLRNIRDFLRVLRQPRLFQNKLMEDWPGSWLSTCYRYLKDYWCYSYKNTQINITVNEDVFWGLFVSARCDFFTVPTVDEAIAFAFEAEPEYLYARNGNRLPFGCHAWQRYDDGFWDRIITVDRITVQTIKS